MARTRKGRAIFVAGARPAKLRGRLAANINGQRDSPRCRWIAMNCGYTMRLSAMVAPQPARMNNHFLNKQLAYRIGVAGTLPFLILMFACWTVHIDWLAYFLRGQLAYGIAILSFLGGVHWSAAMLSGELSEEQTRKAFVWSVLPPVIAWSATLMGGFGFAVLMAGFIGAYQVDKRLFTWYRMPGWFLQLRLRLTCAVVVALALSVIAANIRG